MVLYEQLKKSSQAHPPPPQPSCVVANNQELERSEISVWYDFQNVNIKIQLHNDNLWMKMFSI